MCFMSSKAFSTPPKPASASARIGRNQSIAWLPSACSIWSARVQRIVDLAHDTRHAVDRVERLVGIHGAGAIGVRRDLPAGEIDRLEPGLGLLHGLVAGEGAERVDEGLRVEQVPQLLGAASGQGMFDVQAPAQVHDLRRAVSALDILPTRIGRPVLLQLLHFVLERHRFSPETPNSWASRAGQATRPVPVMGSRDAASSMLRP